MKQNRRSFFAAAFGAIAAWFMPKPTTTLTSVAYGFEAWPHERPLANLAVLQVPQELRNRQLQNELDNFILRACQRGTGYFSLTYDVPKMRVRFDPGRLPQ